MTASDRVASSQLSSTSAICAQVIVAPEDKRTVVFKRGTSKGLMPEIPFGGQHLPTSMFGAKDE